MPVWDDVIPETERWSYRGDFAKRSSRGKKPALLVIDIRLTFAHEKLDPLSAVIGEWLDYWGEDMWSYMENTRELIGMARKASIPIIYTDMRREFDYPGPARKITETGLTPRELTVASMLTRPGDLVIRKHRSSAFIGTLLAGHLVSLGVDTLIACGCVTSNCVRATVSDAAAYNYHVMLVEECTFDKRPTLHKMHLFDINDKIGEVVSLERVKEYLGRNLG